MGVLTPRALDVLRCLIVADDLGQDDESTLLVEGWTVYLGCERVHRSTFNRLIICGALSQQYDDGPYWGPNSTGRAIARRPELADEIAAHYQIGAGAFSIVDDQLVAI